MQSESQPVSSSPDSHILENLNEAQRKAVSAPPSNLLVLAGAGSGKTRVLVHRIAWLIEKGYISPYEVLAVTFTNKAAFEMRARTESLLNMPVRHMWIGTFHGLSHRLLRIHWQEAGLPQGFEIIDAGDQLRLIKRVMKAAKLDSKRYLPGDAARYINKWKDDGQRARHVLVEGSGPLRQYVDVYEKYEQLCNENGLVDFAELLLRSHELWLDHKDLKEHYQNRFRHILVDEFQDTNRIQNAWLSVLAGKSNFVTAVGDDDQSIYGWRGAQISNIRNFEHAFDKVETIRLEQNYRSTETILKAANALIGFNNNRLGKTLWTATGTGEPIRVFNAYNEFDEAEFVADKCEGWLEKASYLPDEIAILYRNNAQSRVLEQVFSKRDIPYRIYGGTRFYDRMEIRNAVAYMKLLQDPNSDVAFERVVNIPPRGAGAQTLEQVRAIAAERSCSLFAATKSGIEEKKFTGRATNALRSFLNLIDSLTKKAAAKTLNEIAEICIFESGLIDFHEKEKGETGTTRKENLLELIVACKDFQGEFIMPIDAQGNPIQPDQNSTLLEFLDQATLDSGDFQSAREKAVNMMTLHSAKGLEFPVVFITGMEEELFPHSSAILDLDRREEERRLAYVGITRSMEQLFLTHATTRTLYGRDQKSQFPSRFLSEIPDEYLTYVRVREKPIRTDTTPSRFRSRPFTGGNFRRTADQSNYAQNSVWKLGSTVEHTKFGSGVIVDTRGDGSSLQLQIQFSGQGTKWILANTDHLRRTTE